MMALLDRYPWLGVALQCAVAAAIGVALHAVLHAIAKRAARRFMLAERIVALGDGERRDEAAAPAHATHGAAVRTESITP